MLQSGTSTATGLVPVLRYRDVAAATDWLCRTFGFEFHRQVEDEDGDPIYVQLRCGQSLVILVPVGQSDLDGVMCQPDEAGGLETQACYVVVPDVVAHHAAALAAGATIVLDLTEDDAGSWGYSCRDLEGHVWSFGAYDPTDSATPIDTDQAGGISPGITTGAPATHIDAFSTDMFASDPSARTTWLKRGATFAACLLMMGGALALMNNGSSDGPMADRAEAKIAETAEADQHDTRLEDVNMLQRQLATERAGRAGSENAAAEAQMALRRLRQQLGAAQKRIHEQKTQLAAERQARKKAEQRRTALADKLRARQKTSTGNGQKLPDKHSITTTPDRSKRTSKPVTAKIKDAKKDGPKKAAAKPVTTPAKTQTTASIGKPEETKPSGKAASPKHAPKSMTDKKASYAAVPKKKTQTTKDRTKRRRSSSVPGGASEPSNPWNEERWPFSAW